MATRVGKSRPAVANTLRPLNLPQTIRERVSSGDLSEGHARALLSLEAQPETQSALMEQILADHLTVRDTERLARRALEQQPKPERERTPRDPHLASLEGAPAAPLRHARQHQRRGEQGRYPHRIYDQEQFERILELLAAS